MEHNDVDGSYMTNVMAYLVSEQGLNGTCQVLFLTMK